MERTARGGGAQERWGRARDRVGGAPASAPGSVLPVTARSRSLTAPAALAAASGSHSDGHRLPFPSGGGGGRSLSSRAPSGGRTTPPPSPLRDSAYLGAAMSWNPGAGGARYSPNLTRVSQVLGTLGYLVCHLLLQMCNSSLRIPLAYKP